MSTSTLSLAPARRLGTSLSAALVILLIGAEADAAWRVVGASAPLTARDAKTELLIYAAAAAAVALISLRSTRRMRTLAVLAPAVLAAGVLLATATFGGQAGAMAAAVLTMTATWYAGERLLRLIGAPRLADRAVVAWLSGVGPLCLLTLLLGRLSLLKWWTMGLLVVVLGGLGCVRASRAIWARRRFLASEVVGSSIGAASAGMIALTIAGAAIYTAAPEIQFDALYAKAYLPALWAHTGTIGPLTDHIQLNITGWFQLMAAWGNLLGAPATGRYMQLFALGASAAVVWSFGRRFGSLGPLAAVIVATTPALFWQATTAYDDLLLAIATFALTVAVFEALQPQFGTSDRATGLALGLMAGTGASLKTYLVPICGALVLAWVLSARRPANIVRRLSYGLIGVFITAAPPLVLRWIDTGNPVFPAYNNIFKSPYWLPVNEQLNFPFWPHPGSWGPVKAVWDALFHPTVMVEATPPGAYGLLIGALVIALLIGWRLRGRASLLLWGAIVLATGFWWVEFRYLRYLLPEAFAALVLLLVALPPGRMALARPRLVVSALAVVAATSFAVTVAQLWNVPNRRLPISAAIGHWSASDYLLAALPERQALLAFNRLAPPGARVVTDNAFERDWLTRGRDMFRTWELTDLLQLHGPLPTSGDGAYARARAMGVDWALLSGPGDYPWLEALVRTHGQLEFSAGGWDLYQFVARPAAPTPVGACDRVPRGLPSCWAITTVAGGGQELSRAVPVCPGELISVLLSQTAGARPTPVVIHFVGAPSREAFAPGKTVPGSPQPISATIPSGAHQAVITAGPLLSRTVTSARLVRFGPGCGGGGPAGA